MKTRLFIRIWVICGLLGFLWTGPAFSADTSSAMGLVKMLTDQLGVTEKQASGGAGSLFQMAQKDLSEDEFGKVSESLPGISQLISAAPDVSDSSSGLSGKMGSAAEGLGSLKKTAENVNRLNTVKNQFSKLGLDEGMVSQFIPIVLKYANTQGGETVMNLLKGVWQ
ncbi:MAG: DUF2780 domain-containing protein [Desulfobacterales bacterium]